VSEDHAAGFLARWSRRKAQVRRGDTRDAEREARPDPRQGAPAVSAASLPHAAEPSVSTASPPPTASGEPLTAPSATDARGAADPLPTLADVTRLTRDSDYARFVRPGVDPAVKNAALKKLFADPHFNVMDGLDVYIDDYGKPDPIPATMLRKLNQAVSLGLFDEPQDEADRRGGVPAAAAPMSHAASPVGPAPAPHDASSPGDAGAQQAAAGSEGGHAPSSETGSPEPDDASSRRASASDPT
jgi:uncharacterized protein DUF3306